jgi:hypothetical protein
MLIKKQFPKIISDNDDVFLSYIEGIVNSVDELACIEVSLTLNGYRVKITSSLAKYNNMLIEEILKLCNLFKFRVEMSKSIKTSSIISFEIKNNN